MIVAALALLLLGGATAQTDVVTVRGSGTTNPKKIMWELADQIESMSGRPIDVSYRGIGSSSGKKEYLATSSHFGCSEIPVTEAEKASKGGETLQLPLVIGAMSVFHSIPASVVGTDGLKLNPCLLAKIFMRNITKWNDTALAAVNPALKGVNQDIVVFHRDKGSSTTNFFTRYLHDSTIADGCATDWPIGWGAALTTDADVAAYTTVKGKWHADTKTVQGSGGMSSGLKTTPYSIGYIDSGHGKGDGHAEVKLKNKAGTYLDSTEAGTAGIQAAVPGTFPKADAKWEDMNLINAGGTKTWPIVAFSYVLVAGNLSALNNDVAQLTKAFLLLTMEKTKGGQKIAADYNFIPIPDALRLQNENAIKGITAGGTAFEWEWSTNTTVGPKANTLSVKRQSHIFTLVEKHEAEIKAMTGTDGSLTAVQAKVAGESSSLPIEVHGSGTTNPSKMIWKMMATMKGMAMRPLHLSYRAIGSSSGIAEFLAGQSHFGSAEIPLTQAQIAGTGSTVLQVPLVLGAMSAFHSVPAKDLGGKGLHLTPCVLAKIFSRGITMWDDAAITALNPDAKLPSEPITMLHRKKGSSTTNFFTKYLFQGTRTDCPANWKLGWGAALTTDADVAKYPTVTAKWAPDSANVITCEGSGQMASNLATIPYSIGYIDSGHGHADGLSEVKLKNKAGNFIDSKEAGAPGVEAAAMSAPNIPATSTGDWAKVDLLNVKATSAAMTKYFSEDKVDKTWPIVAISYLFVKQDLSYLGERGAAVKAFFEYSQSTDKGYSFAKGAQHYTSEFSFTQLPSTMTAISKTGIAGIKLATGVKPFVWEWSTDTAIGSNRNTLSCKRSNYDTYGISSNKKVLDVLKEPNSDSSKSVVPKTGIAVFDDLSDTEAIAVVALVFALLSFVMIVGVTVWLCCCSKVSNTNSSACASDPNPHNKIDEVGRP